MRSARRAGAAAPLVALLACAQGSPRAPTTDSIQTAEIVARLPQSVGNVTFMSDGRTFFSHHPFFEPEVRVAELSATKDGFTPFPSAEWNTPRPGTDEYLDSVLGLRADEAGVVWMLDMGTRTDVVPKLVGWNPRKNQLEGIYRIPEPATLRTSQHNDFVIDDEHGVFFIADEEIGRGGDGSRAALVVVDRKTGKARRLLEGHVSTRPEDVPIVAEGAPLTVPSSDGGTVLVKVGADGIAADRSFTWLYYGPLNGGWVYRVPIANLLDEALPREALEASVERYAEKPNNGGLSIDDAGNLYLTEVGANAVGVIPADTRRYRRLATHPELVWPDGVSFGADGFLYVSAAQVNRAALFHQGVASNTAPYLIFRLRPLAAGRVGH